MAEDEVQQLLTGCADPAVAVQELINAAYLRGAPDNVTCVVADVHDTPGSPQREARAGAVEKLADHR